jgi:hypothetical protein
LKRLSALLSPFAAVALLAALAALPAPALAASDSASLAAKSIGQVYAVRNRVFAFSADGASYSALDLFGAQPAVTTREWKWLGGAEGGEPWSNSLLLRANYWISDSQRVARATSLQFNGAFRGGDSLIFADRVGADTASRLANSANLTALAVRVAASDTTAALGFGRLGVAYAKLAPQNADSLFDKDTIAFLAFPAASDTAVAIHACRWNAPCRVDTLTGPLAATGALDSVVALAVDSSAADSAWLLVATQKGLRRGRWGGTYFPYVALPDTTPAAVRSVYASPSRSLLWIFTGSRYYFSDNHGASFRVPPNATGVSYSPGAFTGFSPERAPSAAFRGDTTFINFNFDRRGLVLFRKDTVLANTGTGLGEVLLDTADGLDLTGGEGSLTMLAVARGSLSTQSVLVVGTTVKGVFYRRLDVAGGDFANINRQKTLKGKLAEVITYPTLISAGKACGDEYSRLGYRLGKDGRVTITVYNYAMEKVRTIVRDARRATVAGRSENIAEDRWDGCDESGRFVSVGTYYVLVQSDQGEKAFGKVLVTRGRR